MARILDEFTRGFGDAIADIREKYEEAVWGRPVTERGDSAPLQWPETREAEQQSKGLSGEILGPESEPTQAHGSAGLLEHGWVVEGQASRESSPQWPQATTYNPEQNRDHSPDVDLER